jgi:hypothetical protein
MNTFTRALVCALAITSSCAAVAPRPLSLPPRSAPLEQRVATYRARAAMPHMAFSGWATRIGDGPVLPLDEARPVLANAAEAEAILHTRDNQLVLGWSLFGVGTAVMLSSLVVLPSTIDTRDRGEFPVLPFALIGLGAAIALPSAIILGGAQRNIPPATEAYNRWLWDALDLPRNAPDGRLPAPTPHPATSAPWQGP